MIDSDIPNLQDQYRSALLERADRICALREGGKTFKEISAEVGVSMSRCSQIFQDRKRRLSEENHQADGRPEEPQEVMALYRIPARWKVLGDVHVRATSPRDAIARFERGDFEICDDNNNNMTFRRRGKPVCAE